MFSKELENLIQATLEDGVLEENEKAALVKRAEREGVDIAELEIYIKSLLQKRARELENEKTAERKKVEKEKKEAFGRKCPKCGAQVPPLTLKCECGYEFTKKESVSSVQVLFNEISKISEKEEDEDKRNERIRETISICPVPNTKEDIIEFLSLSVSKAKKKGGLWGTVGGRLMVFLPIVAIVIILEILLIDPDAKMGHYRHAEPVFPFILIITVGASFFISVALTQVDKEILMWNKNARVWRSKFEQVLMKGRSLRGDAEFTRQLDYYESMLKK